MNNVLSNALESFIQELEIKLRYSKLYLEKFEKINSKSSEGDPSYGILCAYYQAMTDTKLEYIKNEINPSLDKISQLKNLFFGKMALDTYSPRNFPFLDPSFIKYSLEQNYDNFNRGFKNFLQDIQTGCLNNVNKVDFIIGETVATTEGKVVFKNELFELICYKPKNEKVNAIPILIIPACINKYYILDLQQENSLVKWLSDSGYQVFMISWVNPDIDTANFGFEDYIISGVNTAVTELINNFDFKKIHLTGYCLGGILAAISASYFQEEKYIESLTLLATQLDFSEPNDFSIFLEPQVWIYIKQMIKAKGIVSGIDMQNFFNFIKAKEMIFQYIVDNYFYAKPKSKVDFLAWNGDSTNLTTKFYEEYMELTYINNTIAYPGKLFIGNRKVDFSTISIPTFFLGTINDHIVPWKDAFRSMKLFKNSDKNFILCGSGHVAGVINHPSKNKYSFWKNNDHLELIDEKWKQSSIESKGSWWIEWEKWLKNQNSETIESNYNLFPRILDAPGEYVKKEI